MSEDENVIESIAPKESAKIVDAAEAQSSAISDPQKRATNVEIVGALDPSKKGVKVVSRYKPTK